MKNIITKETDTDIHVDQIDWFEIAKSNAFIAYRCKACKGPQLFSVAVLKELHYPDNVLYNTDKRNEAPNYGFIRMDRARLIPAYAAFTLEDAVKEAASNRELKLFYSYDQLISAILKGLL